MKAVPLFTVIGVVNGAYAIRVHDRVRALSPGDALALTERGLCARFKEISPGTTALIGAWVFEGALPCANRSINGPFADERPSLEDVELGERYAYTVLAVDPATKALKYLTDLWFSPKHAENDTRMEGYLIASTLDNAPVIKLVKERALTPPGSTKGERMCALLKYATDFVAKEPEAGGS